MKKYKYPYKPPNFFQRNFSFKGEITVGEFWSEFFERAVALLCGMILLCIAITVLIPAETDTLIRIMEWAVPVCILVFLLSLAALTRRRLRDAGYSAKSYLWLLLPVVGWIIFLIRLCKK